ncbi:XRE family transcriptional regulator [Bacteroidota bacterium]
MADKKKTRSKVEISDAHKEQLIKIGAHVKKLRIVITGDSYEVFAKKNRINKISMWRLETGNNFLMNSLLKVVNGLGISLEEFFKGVK